ncbi:MAG: 2-C-methyl-D-erythritol 4-phosphate cytidylyltransferase [Erysipelotrichaceae bacterium]|nr:2-C-methyl-D-erythritol 4-phosphate cytidylyltransferase [Erysipelotrichaceae bacterium]
MKYDAIVVAGGVGKRAGLGFNKILYKMKNGKSVLEYACSLFFEDEDCDKVIIVTNEDLDFSHLKLTVVPGGKERVDSVNNGLNKVDSEYVFIHDGARPFLTIEDLNKLKSEVVNYDGAILATKAIDTIKVVKDGIIERTIDRNIIYHALTPQAFNTAVLKEAYQNIDFEGITDDASIMEKYGKAVKVVEGSKTNRKLTAREDFENI